MNRIKSIFIIHSGVLLVLISIGGCAGNNRALQLTGGAAPIYPAAQRSQGIEGKVTVRYDVSVEGFVTNAIVIQSTPPGLFDAAALTAVTSWRFNPARGEGIAIAQTQVESTLTFKSASRAIDEETPPRR
jgi:protein TonB